MSRSQGGFSTQVHVAVDALGNPVRLTLSGGQVHDSRPVPPLLENLQPQAVIADKGYDTNAVLRTLDQRKIEAILPPKKNRKEQRDYDRHTSKERNRVERFFNRIKHYRRIATRYDKLDRNFFGLVQLAAIRVLLR